MLLQNLKWLLEPQLPLKGNIFISVKDKDKNFILEICKKFVSLGFKIICTKGTGEYLKKA